MELLYLRMVFRIKYKLWNWWHCKLPGRVYGYGSSHNRDTSLLSRLTNTQFEGYSGYEKMGEWCPERKDFIPIPRTSGWKYLPLPTPGAWGSDSRPWWHLCCNGDAGGWRTDVCDWLEGYPNGWRGLEDRVYLYQEEDLEGES